MWSLTDTWKCQIIRLTEEKAGKHLWKSESQGKRIGQSGHHKDILRHCWTVWCIICADKVKLLAINERNNWLSSLLWSPLGKIISYGKEIGFAVERILLREKYLSVCYEIHMRKTEIFPSFSCEMCGSQDKLRPRHSHSFLTPIFCPMHNQQIRNEGKNALNLKCDYMKIVVDVKMHITVY